MYKVLNLINNKNILKNLPYEDINLLCGEIRHFLINNISKTGGHLSSNLGTVEMTVALHKEFNTPYDNIVWDVGHQSYTHKILTGRKDGFKTLRQQDGMSGFTKRSESVHDSFISGHSGISISVACGINKAKQILNDNSYTIAVIGDGAFTSGIAYEGINNITSKDKNLIIILNDNEMSISKNTGLMSSYLDKIRNSEGYFFTKTKIENLTKRTPVIGVRLTKFLSKSKKAFKTFIYERNFFEELGFKFIGPIDGHNIKDLSNAFNIAKKVKEPVFIHVITKKGKGYEHAEDNPSFYHGISKFDVKKGVDQFNVKKPKTFSDIFGETMVQIAGEDNKVVAITAAMETGTGLKDFKYKYKDRFFDVTIAEQHAVSFCGGLATKGIKPVFVVYSTFIQRAFDQVIHDISMQNLPVLFCIDRAGFVGDDGETHQGFFDIPLFSSLDNLTIYCPSNYNELRGMLNEATKNLKYPTVIRYPKGIENISIEGFKYTGKDFDYIREESKTLIVTYGRVFGEVYGAKSLLKQNNIDIDILKLNKISHLSDEIINIIDNYRNIYVFEECIKTGGIGQQLSSLCNKKINIYAISKSLVKQCNIESAFKQFNLDSDSIYSIIKEVNQNEN
ncbi:MAG: 1-deoxy-D-xylulose-5-phosphate synthase [Oscillospiraceae bacterium]